MRLNYFNILAAIVVQMGTASAQDSQSGNIPVSIPQQIILDLQSDLSLSRVQAAAIAGNLAQESGNFRYLQEINPLRGRGGLGYSQWTGSRRADFENYIGERDPYDYHVNYGFLLEELQGDYSYVVRELQEFESIEGATRYFMRRFLVPHPDHANLTARVSYAMDFLSSDFGGSGCYSDHQVTTIQGYVRIEECPVNMADHDEVSLEQTPEVVSRAMVNLDADAHGTLAPASSFRPVVRPNNVSSAPREFVWSQRIAQDEPGCEVPHNPFCDS